jgi:hypothetical protein
MPSLAAKIRYLFATQFVLGLIFLVNGTVLYPARPAFQLDTVLTPEEMQDQDMKSVAQTVLKRLHERKSDRNFWIIAGIAVSMTSILGVLRSYWIEEREA